MKPRNTAALADVIRAVGDADFGQALDTYVNNSVSFDMSCVFVFDVSYAPTLIHDGYSDSASRNALSSYLKGGHLLDPFYVACVSGHPQGLWRMTELAPDSFFSSEFSISQDIHPCVSTDEHSLTEEIGFIFVLQNSSSVVYSLMRYRGGRAFTDREMSQLRTIEPVVTSSLASHCKCAPMLNNTIPTPRKADVESAFINAYDGRLTDTQRRVVKLILRGHSNASIATQMTISEGTVKLHKSNIYKRLTITTQNELFRTFVNYLIDCVDNDKH